MNMIYQSSKAKRHDHLVYIRELPDGTKEAQASFDKDHIHSVAIDETTGFPYFEPEDGNDHTHELYPYEPIKEKKKRETDEDEVREGMDKYRRARAQEGDSRIKAAESTDFYMCKQWKQADKLAREADGYTVLTVNETTPLVNMVVGHAIKNEKMPHTKPVEGSDSRIADMCNILLRNIHSQSSAKFEKKEAFKEMTVTGRGVIEAYIDTSRRVDGDIRFRHFPGRYVFLGPHIRPDHSDCEYLVKKEWRSLNDLKAQFPDKAKELETSMKLFEEDDIDMEDPWDTSPENRHRKENVESVWPFGEINKFDKTFAVYEVWAKEFRSVNYLIDAITVDNFDLKGVATKDVNRLGKMDGVRVVKRKRNSMCITKIAGNVLLDSLEEDLPEQINEFDVFAAYFRFSDGEYSGLVEDIKDLQRQINFTHSSATDAIRYSAGRAEVYDDETFANSNEADQYRRNRNNHGALLKVKNIQNRPIPKEPQQFPADLLQMEQQNSDKLHKVANIPPELAGQSIDRTSGRAMLISQSQSLTGLQDVFENWADMNKRMNRYILGLIKEYYDPERVARIVLSQNDEEDELSQQLRQMDMAEIAKIWEEADLFDYDLEISESQYTDTFREISFMLMSEMAQQGVPIPADEIIAGSPLPNKKRIMGKIQQQQQQQQAMEQGKTQAEMMKAQPRPNGAG